MDKPSIESMLAGISEAQMHAVNGTECKTVTIVIERDVRNGYVKVIDRLTGIGGDEKRDLHDAVESLYRRLADKAATEERRAAETLTRLGVRKKNA